MAKRTLIKRATGDFIDRAGRVYSAGEGENLLATGQAKLAQWHGGGKKKNAESYEGMQYTGGKKSGTKNLKKVEGGVVNQYGVFFTPEEKKKLENYANKANKKRMRQLKQEGQLPRFVGGEYTGQNVSIMQETFGKESDFIITRKSKSLQRFKTKQDYLDYIKSLEYVNSPDYIDNRTRLYKRNHMKAIENVFGDQAKDVLMKIRMMPIQEYRALIQSDEMLEVNYIYDPSALAGKLNQIRASLGMKLKEDFYEDDEI